MKKYKSKMVEMEESDSKVNLGYQYPSYSSEFCLPTQEFQSLSSLGGRNSSVSSVASSTKSSSRGSSNKSSSELLPSTFIENLEECPYKASGCTEKVPQGTVDDEESEHCKTCQYRPIPCLMKHVCKQLVPYHNFLLHHMQHFIYPSYSRVLNTSVVFEREDFDCNHQWQPRWMNCYDKDFFVMISHKIPGMWYFWVWLLGTPQEAQDFSYDIEVSKRYNMKLGTFPVLSVRTTEDELEKREICLSMTDYQVKRISQIKENLVGSFDIDLMIYKTASSSQSRFWNLEEEKAE